MVSIFSVEDIIIVNCSFENSVGTALGVFYSNLHLHGNSFTNNCNGQSSKSHERLGTGILTINNTLAIHAYNSTLNFIGSILFGDNSAEYGGGIQARNSILNFTGDITFRNNSAKYGGGIYACSSILNFTGNITFEENSAEYGGGISALNSILNFHGSSRFTDNTAEWWSNQWTE